MRTIHSFIQLTLWKRLRIITLALAVALLVTLSSPVQNYISRNISIDSAENALREVSRVMDNGIPVKKTFWSHSKRFLFVAGLEGSGHHAWLSVLKVCIDSSFCINERLVSQAMMQFDKGNKVLHGLFGAADMESNVEHLSFVLDRMHKIVANKSADSEAHLHTIGLFSGGMMSYPNFFGIHKALDYPDLHMLAVLAEACGIDLRILVLLRDPAAILTSVRRRHFGGPLEPKVLLASASALYSQLQLIDSKFIHCLQYESLGHLETTEKQRLLEFIHPGMESIWSQMLSKISYSNVATPPIATYSSTGLKVTSQPRRQPSSMAALNNEFHVKQLRVMMQLIRNSCNTPVVSTVRTIEEEKGQG